jgi:EAL domain-containing protein (putative c-di-GMP-specific phosphodiesterase class I)/ActR/RegA family two-component response regulator
MHGNLTHTASVKRGHVLIVDDDASIRRDYAKMLQFLGHTCVAAQDGQEATALLSTGQYDLILSDIEMPNMGGVEFLRTVRKSDLDVPVVMITGNPELDTAVSALEYGAFRYLTKPVEMEQFASVVNEALTLHRLAKLKREALQLVGAEGKQLGDRASLEARFASALQQLRMVFQPIVNWEKKSVLAYEALMRSDEPSLPSPIDILDAAERLDRIHDLGRCIRRLIVAAAPAAPPEVLLFVNLHSLDLNDGELFEASSPLSQIAKRVVLEITERASLDGVGSVSHKIATLRELGYRVAVDDLGAGYAGLSSFAQIEPEFVKLDMSLVRGVDSSPRKQSVIRAMTQLCTKELGIEVVTEGVETAAERATLTEQGCVVFQGYLFGKPDRAFAPPIWLP